MKNIYTALVNCRVSGSTRPFKPRTVTFTLPAVDKVNPLDIEITAFKEARRLGFEVLHVVSFKAERRAA